MAKAPCNSEVLFMKQVFSLRHQLPLLFALMLFMVATPMVFAQTLPIDEATDAAEISPEDENSTINTIKKVIQEKKTELGSGAAKLRSKRAYLAKVVRVSEETLTVTNHTGNKIIPLDKDYTVIEKANKVVGVDQIAVDDWVGAQGEIVDDNLRINKITIYTKNFTPKDKIIVIGSIATLGRNDLKVTPRSGGETLNLSFDRSTSYQDMTGADAILADFYEELQCIIVAFADDNGNYVVSTIRALTDFAQ